MNVTDVEDKIIRNALQRNQTFLDLYHAARSDLLAGREPRRLDLALEWCETVLQRYKSHPEFLRAKASLLLCTFIYALTTIGAKNCTPRARLNAAPIAVFRTLVGKISEKIGP